MGANFTGENAGHYYINNEEVSPTRWFQHKADVTRTGMELGQIKASPSGGFNQFIRKTGAAVAAPFLSAGAEQKAFGLTSSESKKYEVTAKVGRGILITTATLGLAQTGAPAILGGGSAAKGAATAAKGASGASKLATAGKALNVTGSLLSVGGGVKSLAFPAKPVRPLDLSYLPEPPAPLSDTYPEPVLRTPEPLLATLPTDLPVGPTEGEIFAPTSDTLPANASGGGFLDAVSSGLSSFAGGVGKLAQGGADVVSGVLTGTGKVVSGTLDLAAQAGKAATEVGRAYQTIKPNIVVPDTLKNLGTSLGFSGQPTNPLDLNINPTITAGGSTALPPATAQEVALQAGPSFAGFSGLSLYLLIGAGLGLLWYFIKKK